MKKFLKSYWEQIFFGFVGSVFLAFSIVELAQGDVAGASAVFVMAFFSYFYANIARFKRFKGLGFEAELWEDKQKEAELLIDRLKGIVYIYTRETVLGGIMRGRWGDGIRWKEHWALYDELVEQHTELGQKIDFSKLRKSIEGIFIFDIVSSVGAPLYKAIEEGRTQARKIITNEFGNPIQDVAGHTRRHAQLAQVAVRPSNLFEFSQEGDVAGCILDWYKAAQAKLADCFDVRVDVDVDVIEKLEELSRMYRAGPIEITDELIALAKRE